MSETNGGGLDDPQGANATRSWPERPLQGCEPLMTAAEAYPALERAMLAARRSAWLWFRIFDPGMALQSDEARAVGDTWADLIAHRQADGVQVALAIADFDVLARPALHAAAWRAARRLSGHADRGLALMVTDHAARAGPLWRAAMWPVSLWRIDRLRRQLNRDGDTCLADRPGLRAWLTARDGRLRWRSAGVPALKPGTHHQKVAVFDGGARAILGGLDVDQRRWDTPDHDRAAAQTWRDLSVDVDGPVAVDVARHVAALWNAERRRLGRDDIAALAAPDAPSAAPRAVGASIRLSTTVSGARPARAGLGPRQRLRDLERDHLALIHEAERLIFIETQFLRSRPVARALARRARAAPGLGVVIVLPAAPMDVAFQNARGLDARFGEHLQARCVRRLRQAFGKRLAIVSPARPVRDDRAAGRAPDGANRATLDRAQIVYVHTKALVVDDRAAIVSSANLNGRSLRWDTEAGVVIRDPSASAALRRRLSRDLLPADVLAQAAALDDAPRLWAACARDNAALPPSGRRGLILPYKAAPARRFGAPAPLAPEELV